MSCSVSYSRQAPARRGKARGFSLLEVVLGTAIVGVGVSALMVSVGSGTRVNDSGRKLAQACFVAGEVREWASNLPFSDPNGVAGTVGPEAGEDPQSAVNDLDDVMDVTFSPPRDGAGRAMADLDGWSETITLSWRDGDDLDGPEVTAGSSDFIRVQVDVLFQGQSVLATSFLVSRRSQ